MQGLATRRPAVSHGLARSHRRGVDVLAAIKPKLWEWWQMEEASGNRVGVHAGLTLAPNGTVTRESGYHGFGVSGGGDVANYLSRSQAWFPSSSWSVCVWVNVNSGLSRACGWQRLTEGNNAWQITFTSAQYIFSMTVVGESFNSLFSVPDFVGVWRHFCITWNQAAKTARFYADGVQFFERTTANAWPAVGSETLRVLRAGAGDTGIKGTLDEFSAYSDTLTPDEVAALASGLAYADLP